MKVLLVVPSLNVLEFKGLAKVSYELYKRLPKYGVDVEIFEVYKPKKNYLKNLTVSPLKQLLSKADIIHAVTPDCGTFLPMMFWKKSVTTFHDFIPFHLSERLKFKFRFLAGVYTHFMWRLASRGNIVVDSSQTAEDFQKIYGKKVKVINPGVDERFKPKKVKKDKITLGFFANFSWRKGVDKAIEVFKIVKERVDCKLILAGGKLVTAYQRQFDINKLIKGLKDVKVLGYIPDEEVINLYNSFDFFIFPSIYEGFGLPLLEAQKCGIPALVFDWAKIPKEVTKKAVRCKNVEDMANKILQLLDDRKKYEKIRKEGIEYASKFSWDSFVESYVKVYQTTHS